MKTVIKENLPLAVGVIFVIAPLLVIGPLNIFGVDIVSAFATGILCSLLVCLGLFTVIGIGITAAKIVERMLR